MADKEKLFGNKKIPLKVFLTKSWKYLKPIWWKVLLALLCISCNVILDIILPLFIEKAVDTLNGPIGDGLKIIIGLAVGYFLVALCNQLFRYFESFILAHAGNGVVYQLRIDTFEHIEKMSLDQLEVMPIGSLVTRACNYTKDMATLFTSYLVNILRYTLTIVGVFIVMLTIHPILSLIILGFALIVFVTSLLFRKRVSKLSKIEKGYISDLNTVLSEDLSGMKIIQLFNQEENKKKSFYEKNKRLREMRYKIMLNFTFYRPFINFLLYAAISAIFLFGARFEIQAGAVVAFYLYVSKFFNPIQELSDMFVHIERSLSSCERLYNLLDVQPKVVDKENALDIKRFNGKIEFRNVWFSYDDKNWVLKDVSFVINKGETCAFVGATGAGKTTIFSLLTKSYQPQKGTILIDDIDINYIKLSSLRKGIGQMLQDVFLFSGTIKENITLFDDSYKNNEINSVIRYVNADTFINNLEKGVNQEIVERGENLSAGQRQLLSFARTILHKPQILLLDEATANIDTETEITIQESLEKIKSLGTMLVVAHRLSTIKNSDQIICLQNGEIVERGTHKSLLKQKGYYYKLNELQFK